MVRILLQSLREGQHECTESWKILEISVVPNGVEQNQFFSQEIYYHSQNFRCETVKPTLLKNSCRTSLISCKSHKRLNVRIWVNMSGCMTKLWCFNWPLDHSDLNSHFKTLNASNTSLTLEERHKPKHALSTLSLQHKICRRILKGFISEDHCAKLNASVSVFSLLVDYSFLQACKSQSTVYVMHNFEKNACSQNVTIFFLQTYEHPPVTHLSWLAPW